MKPTPPRPTSMTATQLGFRVDIDKLANVHVTLDLTLLELWILLATLGFGLARDPAHAGRDCTGVRSRPPPPACAPLAGPRPLPTPSSISAALAPAVGCRCQAGCGGCREVASPPSKGKTEEPAS
jgi:hypothetical protein